MIPTILANRLLISVRTQHVRSESPTPTATDPNGAHAQFTSVFELDTLDRERAEDLEVLYCDNRRRCGPAVASSDASFGGEGTTLNSDGTLGNDGSSGKVDVGRGDLV